MIENGYSQLKTEISDCCQRTAFISNPDNNLIEICSFMN